MLIEFQHEYLEELYTEGKTSNKKFRLQPSVIKQYKNTIDKLRAARRIEDLYPIKSLNYEKKRGNLKGIEAVRINMQYRLEFISRIEGNEPEIITICSIIDLSNHYE